MKLHAYRVEVDHGEETLVLWNISTSHRSAANTVINMEGCPRSAIRKITQVPVNDNPNAVRCRDRFRFWTYWNGQFTKLTITRDHDRDDCVSLYHGAKHEEGFAEQIESYWIDGDYLYCQYYTRGRDCDGYIEDTYTSRCYLGLLRARRPHPDHCEPGIMLPEWESFGSSQHYDEYAEAAGY